MTFPPPPSRRRWQGPGAYLWQRAGQLTRSRFLRTSSPLLAGSIAAQLCLILVTPLLTRLYDPHAFGLFAAFNTWLAILGPVAMLRLDNAVPLEDDLWRAARLLWIGTAVAGLLAVGLALLPVLLADVLERRGLADLIGLLSWLPIAVFLFALFQAVSFWQIRHRRYAGNGCAVFGRTAGQVGLHLSFGVAGAGGIGLAAGQALGQLLGLVLQAPAFAELWRYRPRRGQFAAIVSDLRRWQAFPLFSVPTQLALMATQMLPAFLMAVLHSPEVAGLFALGQRLLATPLRMIGQALSQVYFAETRDRSPVEMRRSFVRVFFSLLLIGCFGAIPLLLFAPPLFAMIFGEPWREAGVFVQLLLPLFVLRFAIGPIFETLKAVERQALELATALGMLATVLAVFWFAHRFALPPRATVALLSGGLVLAHLLWLYLAHASLRQRIQPTV